MPARFPLLLLVFALGIVEAQQPPVAARRPITDTYHGVTVTDNYRWLEDFSDPQVKSWVAAENKYSRSFLDALPGRAALSAELASLFQKRSTSYFDLQVAHGQIFAEVRKPRLQQPQLVVFSNLNDDSGERLILDPVQLDPQGLTSIDFFQPSHDGRYVAVSLSHSGSEAGNVHVFEVGTGKELTGDLIPRVNNGTAGGSVAWNAGNSGFYYTRYPRQSERTGTDLDFFQQVWFHQLGTSTDQDRYEIGKDFPRIAEILFASSDDGKYVVASVANGDGGDFTHFLHGPQGPWHQLARYADGISQVHFGPNDSLYLLSKQDAPMGKILYLRTADAPLSTATVAVPESTVAVDDLTATTDRLYVAYMAGGPSQLRTFSPDGRSIGNVEIGNTVALNNLVRLDNQACLFTVQGFTQPSHWLRLAASMAHPQIVKALSPPPPITYDDAEVLRDFAVSRDGARVPLNIIRLKGTKLDGNNPVLLTGYGGYAINITPRPSLQNRFLLNHGFVLVETNLRGGGEYGEKWHLAGNLTHKQNVFDDFYACAQYLIAHHYTTAARLGIMGGSNGGLLMGAELTQHPEMYRVVLAFVGIYDMLRVELSPNGAFNVTEFGTVKELDQFRSLFAYSPYHHVADDKIYPAAIFLTGDNDPRVDPANSRKMVARLQAVGRSQGPTLLRTTGHAGHGIGSSLSEQVAQYTDAFSFLFSQLGVQ